MILTVLRALNIPSRARPWASTTLRSRPPIPIPTDSRCTSETQSTASLLPNMEKSGYRRIIRRTTMTITRREGRRYEHHQRGRLAPEDDHSHARTHARTQIYHLFFSAVRPRRTLPREEEHRKTTEEQQQNKEPGTTREKPAPSPFRRTGAPATSRLATRRPPRLSSSSRRAIPRRQHGTTLAIRAAGGYRV